MELAERSRARTRAPPTAAARTRTRGTPNEELELAARRNAQLPNSLLPSRQRHNRNQTHEPQPEPHFTTEEPQVMADARRSASSNGTCRNDQGHRRWRRRLQRRQPNDSSGLDRRGFLRGQLRRAGAAQLADREHRAHRRKPDARTRRGREPDARTRSCRRVARRPRDDSRRRGSRVHHRRHGRRHRHRRGAGDRRTRARIRRADDCGRHQAVRVRRQKAHDRSPRTASPNSKRKSIR